MRLSVATPDRRAACFALIGLSCLMGSVPSWAQTTGETEREIRGLEEAWATARIKADTAFLERLYAKEFRITGTDGSIIERDTDIALFASGAIKPESIKYEDMRVTVYGNAAVVTGRENLKGTYRGNPSEGALRFTHVFVQRDGRWQLVAIQGTWVKNK